MKKRALMIAVAAMFFGISAKSQIYTRYTQSFEPSETHGYSSSGLVGTDTLLFSAGRRSLHLDQSTTTDAVLVLDTIDLSDMPNLQYATLEFMHICKVRAQSCINPPSGGMIQVKLASQSSWTQLTSTHYDMDWGGGSSDFNLNGYFSDWSYNGPWDAGNNTIPSNLWWKKERFKLSALLNGVQQSNRKLIIRFWLPQLRNSTVEKYDGWYIDDIVVKASASSMTTPKLHMTACPTLMEIPYSRDIRIAANITTTALQGMNSDSIYITYKLGASPQYRTLMHKVQGTASEYEGYLPFCGYDTVVSYRIMAKDSSSNQNYITYPSNEAAFAVAEEFKDIMIRSNKMLSASKDNNVEQQRQRFQKDLTLQWKRFYRPIRGDIWPEEFGSSQKRRDINAKIRVSLDNLLPLLVNEKFEFLR